MGYREMHDINRRNNNPGLLMFSRCQLIETGKNKVLPEFVYNLEILYI